MDCKRAQDILLQAEDPRKGTGETPGYKTHLKGCPACASLAKRVLLLERSWRTMPLPVEAETSRSRFLSQLKKSPRSQRARPQRPRLFAPPAPPARRSWLNWRLLAPALAAAIALIGVGFWLFFAPAEVQASGDVLDDLVEWNVKLAGTDVPAERQKIYEDRAPKLKTALERAALSPEEKEIADLLLENAEWLRTHDDPLLEAERFNDIADKLADRAEVAEATENNKEVTRFKSFCERITEHGFFRSIEKADARPGVWDKGGKAYFERMMSGFKKRLDTMPRAYERMPPTFKKDWGKGFDFSKAPKFPPGFGKYKGRK